MPMKKSRMPSLSEVQTYLIVPALTDQGGQCRIVRRDGESVAGKELQHYRSHSDEWREVGLMNASGRLVCLDAPLSVLADFKDCEPLMAGLVITAPLVASLDAPDVEESVCAISSASEDQVDLFGDTPLEAAHAQR